MEQLFKPSESSIELNHVIYNLALSFAREKLHYALEHGKIPDYTPNATHPSDFDETEYFLEQFSFALNEYQNMDVAELLKRLDATYEDEY